MDEFYEYWELIQEFEKYEKVGKEIVKYKRNLQDPDISARDLPQDVIEFFQHHLVTQPYPTWEILYHIIDIRSHDKNRLLDELLIKALSNLIDAIIKHPEQLDKRDKLYNLLSNIYISEWCMNKIRSIIIPRLYDLKENRGLLDETLLLALLSRSILTLLTHYMDYERQQIVGKCHTKSLFLRTCYEKVHWIKTLLDVANDDAIRSLDHKVFEHLRLLRLILNEKVDSWWTELEDVDAHVVQTGSALELCHIELMRQKFIFQFLNYHFHVGQFDDEMLIKNGIMNQLLNVQVEFSIRTYDAIKQLLQTNHELNQRQIAISNLKSSERRNEVELLNEYLIVKLYLSLIQSNDATQDLINTNLHHIRTLLKTINDGRSLFQLMRNVFTLIFLRFEHIRKTKRKRKNSEAQSENVSNQNNSHTTDVSDATVDTLQSGFVCLRTSLKAILNSMRMFLMGLDQLEVYRTCDDDLRMQFEVMLRNVDNTLWRLRIIDNDGHKKIKSNQSVKEWIRLHDATKPMNSLLEITSDEEKAIPKKKNHRKKLKKRAKIAAKSDENDEASDDPIEYQLVTESSMTENSENRTQSRSTESQRRVRSIISRLLMSPESLVAVCMLKDDHENVQKVIKEYNLSESYAAYEVNFINNFKSTEKSLFDIVDRFTRISNRQTSSMTRPVEIEEIKNIAEAGFEKAKFLNVLDKFTLQNKLRARDCDARAIGKAIPQFPNLKMYQGDLLNVLPLIDFMISLPCPFELNHNIYKHVMKQFELTEIEDGFFGYRRFVKNLLNILTIYKNHNVDKSIGDLFNDEVFTMTPVELKKQLMNRQNLIEIMRMDVNKLNDEPELIEILHKFDLFESEGNFLARIVCYVKSVRHLMKFQTNESFTVDTIIKMNLDDVIGKTIFQQQYSPEQVENFAFNANLNLVHSMAVTGAGEFCSPLNGADDEKLLSLFHMSEIGADSINPELDSEATNEIYPIHNLDILFYIKKEGSFMVAYLVKEIQRVDYKTLKYEESNCLQRMMQLKPLETLMELYDNNKIKTALNYDHIAVQLLLKKIQDTQNLNQKLKILCSITERQWNRNRIQFNELKDSYIEMLITNQLSGSQEMFVMLEEIGSVSKFTDILLKCIGDLKSDEDAERLLRWCLSANNITALEDEQVEELQSLTKKLKLYQKIVKMFLSDESTGTEVTWTKIKQLADEKPAILVNYLLNINTNLVLCLEFLQMHPLKQRSDEITKMWVEALNNRKLNEIHHLMFKIIDTFPFKNVVEFFDFSLGFINNLPSMVRVMNFLASNLDNVSPLHRIRYQKFMISTKIFECMGEGEDLWNLASRPLIILEQFLMNSKIEILRNVIKEVRGMLSDEKKCASCSNTSSSMYQVGENLVYDFDAHHDELVVTNECIDLLLKLYAAKALDFQIIEVHSMPSSTEVASLDSSYGIFQMPKEVPAKDRWIKDDETNHCMCCKRQKFSLLTRRHHCRRCGRVICASCSQNRIQLKDVYHDMLVRVCMDCYQQTDVAKRRTEDGTSDKAKSVFEVVEWKLTGDVSSDQMVRDEFNFEYSPNVGLCIAIINLHTTNDELAKFLLFHCHRLELLLRPIRGKINPEVDVILVAKMLKCLAFSAKIRGADGEANAIIDHADVVMKVAENGCESIVVQIPMEPINSVTIRGIINDLIKAENWKMALELSVKWDRSGTAGVFSAWGVSAIKCGQYRFAREKIALALQPVTGSSPQTNEVFLNTLTASGAVDEKLFNYKRASRSPPLLNEVLESLEASANKKSLLNEPPLSPFHSKLTSKNESAKNVLNVMDSLRKIVDGDYGAPTRKPSDKFDWQSNVVVNSIYYDESMFYLINYGGNIEFLAFLVKNNLIPIALRYVLAQQVSHDLFIQHVFIPVVKFGRIHDFLNLIRKMDASLMTWKQG